MPTDPSRLPTPSRLRTTRPTASRLPTPRRTARNTTDVATPTSIPTPRRLSSNHDTPARSTTSSIPTPRRLSQPKKSDVVTPRRVEAVTPRRTPRTSLTPKPDSTSRPAYRRVSGAGAGDENRRLSAPRYSTLSETRRAPDRPAVTPKSPASRRTTAPRLNPSPYARRSSGAGRSVTRKINMGVDGGRRVVDRVEKRRESGGRLSALESFRAARRASLEGEEKERAEKVRKVEMGEVKEEKEVDKMEVDVEAGRKVLGEIQARNDLPLCVDVLSSAEVKEEVLPDRKDPVGLGDWKEIGETSVQRRKTRRVSARFADVDICLDNVDRLKVALGRRRSYGVNEGEMPETPTLRRTSLGRAAAEEARREREEKENRREKRASLVPCLDDDEMGWDNEDVEDLGVW